MRFIEPGHPGPAGQQPGRHAIDRAAQGRRHWRWLARGKTALVAALLAGCSSPMPPHREQTAPSVPAGSELRRPPAGPGADAPGNAQGSAQGTARGPAATVTASRGLEPPIVVGSWREYRRQVAERLVAANPGATYLGRVPDVLLAIPVLEVELNSDGTVRKVLVLRHPNQARDTTQLAIDAVHRAAPYGNVSRLPKPWKFAETFLFDDARRFKPRTLDD